MESVLTNGHYNTCRVRSYCSYLKNMKKTQFSGAARVYLEKYYAKFSVTAMRVSDTTK